MLAALIIHATWPILSSRKLMKLRQEAPAETWFGILALAGVLFIDVLAGMMIGLLASLAFVVYRSSRPHLSSLGRVPGVAGVFDAEGQDDLDLTSARADGDGPGAPRQRHGGLHRQVHAPVLERARETGLLDAVGDTSVQLTVDLAVQELEQAAPTKRPR